MAQTEEKRGFPYGKLLAGVAVAAAAGAAYYVARERAAPRVSSDTIVRDGAFELRRYSAAVAVETEQAGTRAEALAAGYGRLADYAYAESRAGDPFPLLTPLFATRDAADGPWRVRLVLPETGAPAEQGAGLTRVDLPARRVALIRFTGLVSDMLVHNKEVELREWMAAQMLTPAGASELALYGSPATPNPVRRTELLIPVA